jgi:hypothetical protein
MWVLRYNATRPADGKRVERTIAIGPVRKFASESSASEAQLGDVPDCQGK